MKTFRVTRRSYSLGGLGEREAIVQALTYVVIDGNLFFYHSSVREDMTVYAAGQWIRVEEIKE